MRYTDDACRPPSLTRYITDRCLPDKAIDLVDESGARAKLDHGGLRSVAQVRQIQDVGEKMKMAINAKDYENAMRFDDEIRLKESLRLRWPAPHGARPWRFTARTLPVWWRVDRFRPSPSRKPSATS